MTTTLTLPSAAITTVDWLDINGTPSRRFVLRSDVVGTEAGLQVGGATVSWVDVKDSGAIGGGAPIDATVGGLDSGNNAGWIFALTRQGERTFPAGVDELPALVHIIRGPNGRSDYPEEIGDFVATEVNGFDTLEGTIDAESVTAKPDIYTDGAQWLVIDSQSGELVAAGDLFDPGISGGDAILRADGWGKRLQRQVLRYLLQNRRYSDWSESSSDPYTLIAPGGGGPDDGDSVIQTSSEGGRLLFSVPEGTTVNAGDHNRQAFWAQGAKATRLAFDWEQRFDNGVWAVHVHTATGPGGELTNRLTLPLSGLSDSDVIVNLDGSEDLVAISLYQALDHTVTSDGYWFKVTNPRVNDVPLGDIFTFNDLARDVAGRMRFAVDPAPSAQNILPLDLVGESFGAAMDYGALIEDQRWGVIGRLPAVPVLQTRRWDDEVWELADPEFPVDPIPLPRFDEVDMPFAYPNSSAIGYITVTSPTRLPVPRSFGQVQLDQPGNVLSMEALGERLLAVLNSRRVGGTVTFTRAVVNGEFRTAHSFHGGSIYLPDQDVTCRVKSFSRTAAGVVASLDEAIAPYDRILARRARRVAFHGAGT